MNTKHKITSFFTYLILTLSLLTFGFAESLDLEEEAFCRECIFSGGDSTCTNSTERSRCKSYTDGRCDDTSFCNNNGGGIQETEG